MPDDPNDSVSSPAPNGDPAVPHGDSAAKVDPDHIQTVSGGPSPISMPVADDSFGADAPTAAGAHVVPDDLPGTPSSRRLPKKRQIGPYVLIRLIGRGGMGTVYEAIDTRLNRHVALKVMRTEQEDADPKEIERFRREAQNAGKLRHPNIVPVHDVGVQDGQDYLVMDLVDGVTLSEAIRQQQFTYREKVTLLEKVARAVQYAHEQGVIHRDLKPSNVIVEQRTGGSSSLARAGSTLLGPRAPAAAKQREAGSSPPAAGTAALLNPQSSIRNPQSLEPLVMDFGLAKDLSQDSSLSASGQMLGTPAYMPPEQAMVHTEDVGPRSDVYGLGAILYELLTGRPPFTAESIMPLLKAVIMDEPVPPRRIDPKVPRDLETICLKCLEKEAARRYESAASLADDLKNWLDGDPIKARAYTWTYRAAKKIAKHRVPVALATLVFVLLVSFGGWYAWEWWKEYGKWTKVFSQDFSESQDLSAFEFPNSEPWKVENGTLVIPHGKPCWLRSVRLSGETRLELRIRFPKSLDGLDMFINSQFESDYRTAPGFSAQVAGYSGSVDFVSRNEHTKNNADTTSGVLSCIEPRRTYSVVFQHVDGRLSLFVDGQEVSWQSELLPVAGQGLDRIGLRTWSGDGVEVFSIRVFRRALAQKTSPVAVADGLYKAGHTEDALREYRAIADDYEKTGIAELALTKAYLIACSHTGGPVGQTPGPATKPLDDGEKVAAEIRTLLDKNHLKSRYRAQVLEAEALALWRKGRFRQALDCAKRIAAEDCDTRIVLRMLNARREPLTADVGRDLLNLIAKCRRLSRLDIGGLGLTDIDALRGLSLTALNCGGNRLDSLEPLRDMPLTWLECSGNLLTDLEPLRRNEPKLKYLNCENNFLTSLEPLRGMKLEALIIKGNQLESLEPLRGMSLNPDYSS